MCRQTSCFDPRVTLAAVWPTFSVQSFLSFRPDSLPTRCPCSCMPNEAPSASPHLSTHIDPEAVAHALAHFIDQLPNNCLLPAEMWHRSTFLEAWIITSVVDGPLDGPRESPDINRAGYFLGSLAKHDILAVLVMPQTSQGTTSQLAARSNGALRWSISTCDERSSPKAYGRGGIHCTDVSRRHKGGSQGKTNAPRTMFCVRCEMSLSL